MHKIVGRWAVDKNSIYGIDKLNLLTPYVISSDHIHYSSNF